MIGLYTVCSAKERRPESYWLSNRQVMGKRLKAQFTPNLQQQSVKLQHPPNVWDAFYKLHNEAFFKDRHYFAKEHVRLCERLQQQGVVRILDFGCGVGNSIVPLLETCGEGIIVHYLGLDISPHAIALLRQRLQDQFASKIAPPGGGEANGWKLECKVLDLQNCTEEEWHASLGAGALDGFDFCLMIFTLSAFEPKRMKPAMRRVARALAPHGGTVCFRDYCVGDLAMQRFSPAQQLGRNLFQRQDGTLSFFFTPAGLISLFENSSGDCARMKCAWTKTLNRTIENRGRQTIMNRTWLGAEFVKN